MKNQWRRPSNCAHLAPDRISLSGIKFSSLDPDPFHPDIVFALEDVSTAAQGAVQYIHDNPLGDEVPDQFLEAVEDVKNSAQAIVNSVDYYLGLEPECSATCAEQTNASDCAAAG